MAGEWRSFPWQPSKWTPEQIASMAPVHGISEAELRRALERSPTMRPMVPVTVGQFEELALVDTGSERTHLPQTLIEPLGIPKDRLHPTGSYNPSQGVAPVLVLGPRPIVVEVGGIPVAVRPAFMPKPDQYGSWILGTDTFDALEFDFDKPNNVVRVRAREGVHPGGVYLDVPEGA